jgi:MoaA/NifB/PqqE/SkfB family radical SAM enzyme
MCFNWRNTDDTQINKKELTLDEIKKTFNNFGSIQQLTISGGEPFLRNDLPEILEFVSFKNDVQMITIPTNGILSDQIFSQTKNILQKIKKGTHLRISLSLEGIEDVHDDIVQVKGAFRNILDTYNKLATLVDDHKNFNIDIGICCSVFNKDSILNTIQYCADNLRSGNVQLVLARGDTRDKSAKQVTIEEYSRILNEFNKIEDKKTNKPFAGLIKNLGNIVNSQVIEVMKNNKMPNPCYAGHKLIVIQSDGSVLPCEYLDKKLGNLRDFDFNVKKILANNKDVRRFIKKGMCYCTWECALSNNIVCNPRKYPAVIKEMIKTGILNR